MLPHKHWQAFCGDCGAGDGDPDWPFPRGRRWPGDVGVWPLGPRPPPDGPTCLPLLIRTGLARSRPAIHLPNDNGNYAHVGKAPGANSPPWPLFDGICAGRLAPPDPRQGRGQGGPRPPTAGRGPASPTDRRSLPDWPSVGHSMVSLRTVSFITSRLCPTRLLWP